MQNTEPARRTYSETLYESLDQVSGVTTRESCYASLRVYPWKLIWDRIKNTFELYRLDQDPRERKNLVAKYPDLVSELSLELRKTARDLPTEMEVVDQAVKDRLTALGYL